MSLEIYVIPPRSSVELMDLGDRYFCLAQQYLSDENYRNFFKQKVAEGKWVTLDCGTGDHDPVSKEGLLQVARELKPSELIPLDVLFDSSQTIKNLVWTIKQMQYDPELKDIEIFACPQGRDFKEWLDCYDFMLCCPEVKTIGLSKIAVPWVVSRSKGDENIARDRNKMYQYLKLNGYIKKNLHFLGAGEPWEFQMYKSDPLCRSTDSCFTVLGGLMGEDFTKAEYKRIPTPKNYFDLDVPKEALKLIKSNIRIWKSQCSE